MFDLEPSATYLTESLINRGRGIDRHNAAALAYDAKREAYWSRRTERMRGAVRQVAGVLEAGTVSLAVYNEIKSLINTALEEAWSAIKAEDIYWNPQLHTIAGRLKKTSAAAPEHAFLTMALPLAQAIERIKTGGMITKRQPKPVEDIRAKYLAPRAEQDAIAQVQSALVAVTETKRADLVSMIIAQHQKAITHFLTAADLSADAVITAKALSTYLDALRKRGHRDDKGLWSWVDLAAEERAKKIAHASEEHAKYIQETFIIKNLKKLEAIIDAKGNFATIEVVGASLSLGSLEGVFHVTFADGSSFVTSNTVVWSISSRGKPFVRFPLTFHNVVLPGNEKMPRPSEERMNTIFTLARSSCP